MHRLFVMLAVLFFLLPSIAHSFDTDGFKDGMSKEEIKKIVATWNFDTIQDENDSIIAFDKPDNGAHRFYQFFFCNNKLNYLQKGFEPSMKSYILLFKKLSSDYGTKIRGHSDIYITSNGENRFISLTWELPLESITLTYNIFPTNDDLTIRYQVYGKCKEKTGLKDK